MGGCIVSNLVVLFWIEVIPTGMKEKVSSKGLNRGKRRAGPVEE